MKKRIGFTLVELLVVITIIAMLLAILIPALQRAQGQAKTMICRGNVKQWGVLLTMYTNANNGHFMPGFNVTQGMWMVKLRPYYSGARNICLCPKATKYLSISNMVTTIFTAWGVYGSTPYKTWYSPDGVPPWGEKDDYGSYGINSWVHDPPDVGDLYTIPVADRPNYWRTVNVLNPGTIPVFGDSVWEGTEASSKDNPPPEKPGVSRTTTKGMFNFCIPRHGLAINMVFLDNSAKKIPLTELWNQKWSPGFRTGKNVDWPNWMREYWGN